MGILLARSDWDAPKHRGCTYLLVDMRSPGVHARPVRQMTGASLFDEVELVDVRVPDSQRLGPVGDGWQVALTTLMNERQSIGTTLSGGSFGYERILADLGRRDSFADPLVRQLAAQLHVEAKCLQHLNRRAVARMARGEGPGPEGSVAKLALSRVARSADRLLDAMRGADAMLCDRFTESQLFIPAVSIAGGTDEVLKNLIGERVLGLPTEPRSDKDVPFRNVPRAGGA
jgi:alkylation response protein AidB-like acyl-CoA dehydrogenase